MVFSLKVRLAASVVIVVLAMGIVSTIVGTRLFGDSLVEQAQSGVEQDLSAAYLVYNDRIGDLESVVELMAGETSLIRNTVSGNPASLSEILRNRLVEWNIDMLTVTDADGVALARGTKTGALGDDISADQVVARVLASHDHVSGTSILDAARLASESPELAARAHIPLRKTERARPSQRTILDEGMVLNAGAPILAQGRFVGVLYGGILLNRQEEMVDRIKETAHAGETWRGKDVGTATIFQDDVRIATNVMDEDGNRAIGTRVSSEVYDTVIEAGDRWIARAFVVNNSCITGYGPICDLDGKRVGIIYVGVLAAKFDALRERTVLTFAGVSIGGMVLALIIASVLATGILRPLRSLRLASQEIADGKLDTRVDMGPNAADEFLEVAEAFNTMAESIAERDAQLQENARKMTESKKLATLGQLAAGIAHEINNPLGGIVMYSHMLREDLQKEENRENVEKIGREADRCKKIVKGLLDFARQTKPERTVSNISLVINEVIALLEHQAIFHNIEIVKDFDPSIPLFDFDVTQIQEVFMNLILNAAQAMDGRGTLTIVAQLMDDDGSILVEIRDTGPGISPDNIDKIFEPFFTTKEIGRGTGLGLAIAYGIIERHHGKIWVESKLGEGTLFSVRLPIGGDVPPM
jgi:two-component system NtrC family sensor kinase